MKKFFLCSSLAFLALFFLSCENSYRNRGVSSSSNPIASPQLTKENNISGIAKDAYQVSAKEFDQFFLSRYGLLYQKFSDLPFTGRIVMVEKGEKSQFVAQDESWKEGRKHGVSTRWFSNGIKMYERNYNEGRWHGTVTRWWPNGQKMYVRAYTNGKRHGKEATWRSDGTPASVSTESDSAEVKVMEFEPSEKSNSLPSVSIPLNTGADSTLLPSLDSAPSLPDEIEMPVDPSESSGVLPIVPEPAVFPEESAVMPPLPEPSLSDTLELPPMSAEDSSPDPADFPSMPEEIEGLPPLPDAEMGDSVALPPMSNEEPLPDSSGLPPLPDDMGDLPPLPGGSNDLPPLPGTDSEDALSFPPMSEDEIEPMPDAAGSIPPLPGDTTGLPPLPGMDSGDNGGLPPLPPTDPSGLPPLPGMGLEDGDGLPPLPAFPE